MQELIRASHSTNLLTVCPHRGPAPNGSSANAPDGHVRTIRAHQHLQNLSSPIRFFCQVAVKTRRRHQIYFDRARPRIDPNSKFARDATPDFWHSTTGWTRTPCTEIKHLLSVVCHSIHRILQEYLQGHFAARRRRHLAEIALDRWVAVPNSTKNHPPTPTTGPGF